MPRKNIENAIQSAVISHVKSTYPNISIIAIRNEDMRYRSDEIEKGIPDLELKATLNNTRHILSLELKTKKGKLNEAQIEWNEKFDSGEWAFNHTRDVAYGLKDARKKIQIWATKFNNKENE